MVIRDVLDRFLDELPAETRKIFVDKKLSPNALDELCAAARNISDIRVDKVAVFPYTEYQILRKEARRMSYLYFAAGSILVQGTGLSVLRARKRG